MLSSFLLFSLHILHVVVGVVIMCIWMDVQCTHGNVDMGLFKCDEVIVCWSLVNNGVRRLPHRQLHSISILCGHFNPLFHFCARFSS